MVMLLFRHTTLLVIISGTVKVCTPQKYTKKHPLLTVRAVVLLLRICLRRACMGTVSDDTCGGAKGLLKSSSVEHASTPPPF